MTENTTDSDAFINIYIKKQEEFNIRLIREKLELETKFQLLQNLLTEKNNEKSNAEELLKQSTNGIQALTLEKEALKKQIDDIHSKMDIVRKMNEQLQVSLKNTEHQIKDYERLKSDFDTLKTNYELVKKAYEELSETQKPIVKSKKKKKEPEPDWVDGNDV